MRRNFHIAQVNIARMRAPLDNPILAGFVARLENINALAESTPGFVWRLQTHAGDATALRPYEDDRILFNLSVWEGPEQLRAFVCRSAHVEVMRQRKSWVRAIRWHVLRFVVDTGRAYSIYRRGKGTSGASQSAWRERIFVFIREAISVARFAELRPKHRVR